MSALAGAGLDLDLDWGRICGGLECPFASLEWGCPCADESDLEWGCPCADESGLEWGRPCAEEFGLLVLDDCVLTPDVVLGLLCVRERERVIYCWCHLCTTVADTINPSVADHRL